MSQSPSFARRVSTAAFISLLMLALFLPIGYAATFFFPVFGGIAFAVVVSALAHFVSDRTPLPYGWSVSVVVLVLVGIIGGTVGLLAPTVSEQADQLTQPLPPAGLAELKETLSQAGWGQRLLAGIPENPGKFLSSGGAGKGVFSQLTCIVSGTLSGLVNVLVVVITGISELLHLTGH